MAKKEVPTEPMRWEADEYRSLYQARDTLVDDVKKRVGLRIPIEVYVQDPFVAEQNKGVERGTIHVSCEPNLMDGPTSARIAVVDYDADTNRLETPVEYDWKMRRFLFTYRGERVPVTAEHRGEPQFHQVNVWAIIQSVLDMYEASWVLGRAAPWAFKGNRLIVVPHAGYLANAFYDRGSKSIQFYYFGPEARRGYTCLSHDIIAHETGHAILDGLRPHYVEDSSLQTTAFHESVADLTAILASLLNNQIRWQVADEFVQSLSPNPIDASLEMVASLAEEFGRYATGRDYLRSAQNQSTTLDVKDNRSPYDWSEVLTGAMFEIFKAMVARYLEKDLKSGKKPSLKTVLSLAANRFRRTAFQPLDYLPPVDVRFGDYARAVLRADEVVDPVDEDGYRDLMRGEFDRRLIDRAEEEEPDRLNFYAYDIDRVSRSRTDAYHFLNENRHQLCIPDEQDISVVDLYRTDKTVGPGGGKLPQEIVVQYAWSEDVALEGADYRALAGERVALLCGGTLIFDGRGNLLYWVRKPGTGKQLANTKRWRKRAYCDDEREKGTLRRNELLAYVRSRVEQGAVGLVEPGGPEEVGARPPVAASRRSDGTLRLEATPHLRHWTGE